MLGNNLINFIKGKNTGKYSSVSKEEREHLQSIVDDFIVRKGREGSEFDIKAWASSIDILNDKSVDFLSNIKDGDNIMEGLANSMGKTTKAVTSSGAEIELTGNKYKDFFNRTKESFSTFGKVAKNGLKSFGLGLAGTAANVGINFLIGRAIEAAISAWQKYSNIQEEAISRSQNATQKLQENQNKIKNAQSVLNDIQSNKVIDTNGNEITRFEQLSRGVNSLGENVSLTTSEFEEYNSILSSMTGAGLNATTSMANLEKQVKDLRRSANSDSLTGLGDWVEGFNAKNNQLYSDTTKEIGYQQQLSVLNKLQSKNISGLKKHSFWDDLSASIRTANELTTASNAGIKEAEKHLKEADKIQKENVLSKTDAKALKKLAKEYSLDIFDEKGEIDSVKLNNQEIKEQLEDVRTNLESQVESMVRESSGFLQAMFENSPEFNKISSSAANAIGQIFGNIDYDTISKHMLDSNGMLSQTKMKDWVKGISEGVKDKSVQEQLSQLFNLDTESNKKTFNEFEKQANQLLNGITKKVPGISKALLKNATGIEDTLSSASTSYERVSKTVGKEFANLLNLKDLDLAAEIISQQDVKNAEQLKQALLLAKQAAFDMNANPVFDKIAEAKETKNSGDDYVKATTYLKEAKEMFDNGLVGTDDFKSIAKYLSPTGSEDPANFLENYGKAARYLTEDGSGVSNFLNDLNKKGYATFEKLSDGTKKWSYNIQDLQKASQDMGIGFEFMMDMFGRLEDYGFSNNFISSQEDGIQKITDKTTKLAQAKKELAEMETTGQYTTTDENGNKQQTVANQTAIDAKKAEIAGLENDLNELQNSLNQYNQATADSINQQIEKSKQMYSSLKEERDKILSENRYGENTDEVVKGLDEQLRQIAQEGYFEIDGEMNIVNGDDIQEIVDGLDPVKLPVDAEATFNDLKDAAQESLSTVQQMVDFGSPFVKLNLDSMDTFDLQNQIVAVSSAMERLKNEDGTINISAPGAQDAINVLSALITKKQELSQPTIMSISTDSLDADLAAVVTKLQEFQKAYNELEKLNTLKQAGVDVDTSAAEEKVSSLKSELESMEGTQANIKAALEIDTTTIESTLESIKNITAQDLGAINVGATVTGKEEVDALKSSIDSVQGKTEEVKADVKGKKDVDALKSAIDNVKSKTVEVKADVSGTSSVNSLASAISSLKDKSITVTTTHISKNEGATASGTMLSPAHANGTAYNTLNMSPAHASGNVAIQRDEKSLINEVGMESIVRDGIWRLIPGGAHFEQLKKGDIVFNASQTEQLLKYGSISGRGRAYADGTVGNVRDLVRNPLSAYARGSGGGILGAGGSGSKANFGSSGKSTSSTSKAAKDTKKVANNTKDAADSAKEFEETLDHIVTLIDRTERSIKNLERTATSTYETLGTRTDALKSELSELTKEIDIQSKAYDRYLQEANSVGLSEDYAEKVRNGLIDLETITDEELNKSISSYKDYYEKALDCRDAVEELKESVKGLYEESFNNLVKEYDNMLSQIEHRKNILEGYIKQTETQGYIVSTKYYAELIKNEQSNLEDLTSKRNSLLASLNDAVSNGNIKMYSEAWYEMQQEINDVNEAIQSANTSIIEYGNSIRNIKWDVFDKLQDKISSITDESDFIIDLMSNDKLFDDKGNITEQGKASMGLHGVNYNTYMSQADQYRKEMEAIQAEIAKDPYNQELVDRRKELLELQQESIIAAENEKEAIKDLVEEGIDKQLESLKDLIDKQGEMLDSQKDMYDWQKEIAEKQKDIATLEKQLSAYAGDNSEEGMAKRQELSNELGDAKTELDESFFEKSISEQKKLLDELYTQYELILNSRLDNIDMLITDMIANINSESSGIRDTIISEAANVGYTLTDSMNQIWTENTNNIAGILSTYSSNFSSVMTSVQQALNEIKVYIQNAINASNKKAETNINTANKNQADQVKPPAPKPTPPTPKPEPPKNNGGDGVPKIGDAVTFVSGRYYYSSDGLSPSGNQMLGQTVYIGHINNASWAKKPYAIYRDKEFKHGLGWVTLDQLKGYKTGKKHIDEDQIAMINEKGVSETLVKKDGTIITQLGKGDSVLNHKAHNNIWEMANNPREFINNYSNNLSLPSMAKNASSQNISNTIDVNIEIGKVTDLNSFLKELQSSKQFEKMLEQMSIGKMLGKPTLTKYNIKL